jgi:hypothetical protein
MRYWDRPRSEIFRVCNDPKQGSGESNFAAIDAGEGHRALPPPCLHLAGRPRWAAPTKGNPFASGVPLLTEQSRRGIPPRNGMAKGGHLARPSRYPFS